MTDPPAAAFPDAIGIGDTSGWQPLAQKYGDLQRCLQGSHLAWCSAQAAEPQGKNRASSARRRALLLHPIN